MGGGGGRASNVIALSLVPKPRDPEKSHHSEATCCTKPMDQNMNTQWGGKRSVFITYIPLGQKLTTWPKLQLVMV